MNSLQFAQLWLPFGEFRYPTDDCDIFAAAAGYAVANTIGAAMTAQVAPCKTERREIFVDQIFWFSAISAILFKPVTYPPSSAESAMMIYLKAAACGVIDPHQRMLGYAWLTPWLSCNFCCI